MYGVWRIQVICAMSVLAPRSGAPPFACAYTACFFSCKHLRKPLSVSSLRPFPSFTRLSSPLPPAPQMIGVATTPHRLEINGRPSREAYSFHNVVMGGNKGHWGDYRWASLLPHLHHEGCAPFAVFVLHVAHGRILLQTWGGAAAGHCT